MSYRHVEQKLEDAVSKWAEQNGIKSLKFTPLGQRGYPDRIFMYWGHVAFIEFKAEGEELRKLQEYRIDEMKDNKMKVLWTDNFEEAVLFLTKELL